jgi:hypothetical protein
MYAPWRAAIEWFIYHPVHILVLYLVIGPVARDIAGPQWHSWLMFLVSILSVDGSAFMYNLPLLLFLLSLPLDSRAFRYPELRGLSVDELGRSLMQEILRQRDITGEVQLLKGFGEEGNLDDDHFHAWLWLWMAARYLGDATLERSARLRCEQHLIQEGWPGRSSWLWSRYMAWHVRAEVAFRGTAAAAAWVIPPKLPGRWRSI